jgi:hypothetical protein
MAIDFPANPASGQQFTAGGITWTFDGVKWTMGGTAPIYFGDAAPLNPAPGTLWWDTISAQLFIWYVDSTGNGQWVVTLNLGTAGPVGPVGPIGPVGPQGPVGPIGPQGLIADAPSDGTAYLRSDAGWESGGTLTEPLVATAATGGSIGQVNLASSDQSGNWIGGYQGTFVQGSQRWWIGLGDGQAETGGNAGSNFQIQAADDTGAYLGSYLTIDRASAMATFDGYVKSAAGLFYTQAPGPTDNCHYWFLDPAGNTAGILYWLQSANEMILQHQASGQTISIDAGGNCWLPLDVHAGYGYQCRQGMNGGYGANRFNFWYNAGDGSTQGWIDATYMGNIGWVSDYRIKKNLVPLGSTWEQVKALKPISYSHRDYTPENPAPTADGSPPPPLIQGDDVERWGFVAHELQETLTESAATGVKDQADCIQSPNPWTVIAALTKALQEAMTRIEALEAAR